MARLSKPLIPDGPIKVYYERLHAMHQAAGQPSVRQLQRATRGSRWPNGINPTTIHDVFVKPRVATWAVVQEIVRRLGGDVRELAELWRRAREAQQYYGEECELEEVGDATVPWELPPDVPGFTGREGHLERLDELTPRGAAASPVVAIDGKAGVGKTSLAVHWGHRVRDRFPDGQLYLDLRGHSTDAPVSPSEALSSLLRALGVPAEEDLPAAAVRYRSLLADRKVLVLLDDATDAEQVRPLLPDGPGCMVIVISRARLSGLVAQRLCVESLSPLEARAFLCRVLGRDRAEREAEALDKLAESCDHLPLALQLAAADLRNKAVSTVAEYVTALGVRSAFDLSYSALSAPAQRLFRLMGLAPGRQLTAEAAAALAGISNAETARLLERLVAARLLSQREPGRYSCHDLVRDYAAGRAEAEDPEGERRAALLRLYSWYLSGAAASAKMLYPHRIRLPLPDVGGEVPSAVTDEAAARAWLDVERPNLVGAVRQAARHGPWRVAWQLADLLRGYFRLGMHIADWAETAGAALAAAEAGGDLRAQAAALMSIGDTEDRLDRRGRAIELYGRALEVSRRAGWREGQTAALARLGTGLSEAGRLLEAAGTTTRR